MSGYETCDTTEAAEVDQSEAAAPESLSPAGQRAMQGGDYGASDSVSPAEVGDIQNVSVDQINNPEVNGPEDFREGSYDGLRQDMEHLQELRPHVEAGQGEETADTWDRQQGLGHYTEDGYERGYTDAYRAYYGDDAIALSPRDEGRYDIINGRHRVYLAEEMGIDDVPARVLGPVEDTDDV
jgi:hypothetical protein